MTTTGPSAAGASTSRLRVLGSLAGRGFTSATSVVLLVVVLRRFEGEGPAFIAALAWQRTLAALFSLGTPSHLTRVAARQGGETELLAALAAVGGLGLLAAVSAVALQVAFGGTAGWVLLAGSASGLTLVIAGAEQGRGHPGRAAVIDGGVANLAVLLLVAAVGRVVDGRVLMVWSGVSLLVALVAALAWSFSARAPRPGRAALRAVAGESRPYLPPLVLSVLVWSAPVVLAALVLEPPAMAAFGLANRCLAVGSLLVAAVGASYARNLSRADSGAVLLEVVRQSRVVLLAWMVPLSLALLIAARPVADAASLPTATPFVLSVALLGVAQLVNAATGVAPHALVLSGRPLEEARSLGLGAALGAAAVVPLGIVLGAPGAALALGCGIVARTVRSYWLVRHAATPEPVPVKGGDRRR